jgi:hypothetical protein
MRYATLGLPFLALALNACCSGGGSAPAEITGVKLGKLMNTSSGYRLRTETSRLPLIAGRSGDTDRTFGLCFHYKEASKLGNLSIVVTAPAPFKTTTAGFSRQGAGNVARLTIEPMSKREGDFCQEMFFDANDPPGRWRMTLMRNESAVKTFDVDVYRPLERPPGVPRTEEGGCGMGRLAAPH